MSFWLALSITGMGFEGYQRWCLGMQIHVLSWKTYCNAIELAFQYIKEILDETCKIAKDVMKSLSGDQLGSWTRVVTNIGWCLGNLRVFKPEFYFHHP